MGKLLGIDHGEKRLGLALSDALQIVARPLQVVEGEAALWGVLGSLIEEEAVERIVLGLPRNMDGSLGPKAREVLEFRERLAARTGLPVESWDERLTTIEAENVLKRAGERAPSRRRKVDMVAAQILLQSYLDRRASASRDADGKD